MSKQRPLNRVKRMEEIVTHNIEAGIAMGEERGEKRGEQRGIEKAMSIFNAALLWTLLEMDYSPAEVKEIIEQMAVTNKEIRDETLTIESILERVNNDMKDL